MLFFKVEGLGWRGEREFQVARVGPKSSEAALLISQQIPKGDFILRSIEGFNTLQVVWDGQASEHCQTFVPHIENRADRLGEGHMESVQVLGAHSVVEGQGASVVVEQHSHAAQVGGRLDGHLFAVVAHHPGIVAATEYPGS